MLQAGDTEGAGSQETLVLLEKRSCKTETLIVVQLLALHTNDCIGNEDQEKAVAVEVELKKRRYGLSGRDGELAVAIGAAGHVDAFFQEVEGTHDHVLGVS